jgi:serine/threonine protein kinase
LFGAGDDVDTTLQRIQIFCHPDKHPYRRETATRLFVLAGQLADKARGPAMTVTSPTRAYTVERRLASGDVADVYVATGRDIVKPVATVTRNRILLRPGVSEPDQTYTIKVSRIQGAEALLDREQKVLLAIEKAAIDKNLDNMRSYYPTLVESFPAKQRFQRRVNVFVHQPGMFTFEQVADKHHRLDARHSVWIFKRLLTALAFAHQQGIVHSAITPEHVMIRPENHQVQIIGWGQSVAVGQPIKSYPLKYKPYYPDEAFAKRPTHSGADIHMAAFLVSRWTAFKASEESLRMFFNGCRCEGQWQRPVDGFELYDEFDRLAKRVYGDPKFVELKM